MKKVEKQGSNGKAGANLHVRGVDKHGHQLIYDSVLDITWYDHANHANWQDQMDWAESLVVEFDGTIFDDWRLPKAVDGPYSLGKDGKSTAGFNITTSEMGHLFYLGLGNKGIHAPDGNTYQPGWGLQNKKPFKSLDLADDQKREYEQQTIFSRYYWTCTEHPRNPGTAWYHIYGPGYQDILLKGGECWAMPVRDGDVMRPEPGANLHVRGVDSKGHRLIYDSDLDITWYDYSSPHNSWQKQMDWAKSLVVEFEGKRYKNWRLPEAVDGPYILGTNGKTTAGFNITTSELGHLFYIGLGNKAIDTFGGKTNQPGWGLKNRGPFENLQIDEGTPYGYYWTGTECKSNQGTPWFHILGPGFQGIVFDTGLLWAVAVRDGDIAS